MKPIQLILSAFGPYAGEERIDFSQIRGGLYLITGAVSYTHLTLPTN